jgi:hypothetical protein
MRLVIAAFAAASLAPTFASAEKKAPEAVNPADLVVPVANPADYAVPVEAFKLGKAKVKPYDLAFSASEYIFASTATVREVAYREGFLKNATYYNVTVDSTFTRQDGAPIRSGRCAVTIVIRSGAWNKTEYRPYGCKFDGVSPTSYSLESMIPDLVYADVDREKLFTIERNDPDKFKALKATMRYNDVVYEAVPTGLSPDRESEQRRVAHGYFIRRDGKLVGRIDFPNYRGVIVDESRGYDRKSVITAPLAESDGREAVIFFAAQLLRLPEADTPGLQ